MNFSVNQRICRIQIQFFYSDLIPLLTYRMPCYNEVHGKTADGSINGIKLLHRSGNANGVGLLEIFLLFVLIRHSIYAVVLVTSNPWLVPRAVHTARALFVQSLKCTSLGGGVAIPRYLMFYFAINGTAANAAAPH